LTLSGNQHFCYYQQIRFPFAISGVVFAPEFGLKASSGCPKSGQSDFALPRQSFAWEEG
jgi:hypothetical protein